MTAPDSYFNRMHRGEIPPPPIGSLLGLRIEALDLQAGTLQVSYEGLETFRNPAGKVAGGMLSAMLDDLTALAVDATLAADQYPLTLSLNTTFLRPAEVGPITGHATLVRRGQELCHVTGMLKQRGKDVAMAVAICKIVRR